MGPLKRHEWANVFIQSHILFQVAPVTLDTEALNFLLKILKERTKKKNEMKFI